MARRTIYSTAAEALAGIGDGTSNTVLFGHGNIRTSQYKDDANVTLSCNIFVGGTTGTRSLTASRRYDDAVRLYSVNGSPSTATTWPSSTIP